MPARVCVARIGAPHGVKGEVRLWSFTADPLAVRDYRPLVTKDGARQLTLASLRPARDHLVARFDGVTTRDDAQRLNGLELYVPREALPPAEEGEYYLADLIGLAAETAAGEAVGRVIAVHNFGAGDILEIAKGSGPTLMLPFTDAAVPEVDVAGGRVVIDPPSEIDGED